MHVHTTIIMIVNLVIEVLPSEICDIRANLSGTWQRVAREYCGGVCWRAPPSSGGDSKWSARGRIYNVLLKSQPIYWLKLETEIRDNRFDQTRREGERQSTWIAVIIITSTSTDYNASLSSLTELGKNIVQTRDSF